MKKTVKAARAPTGPPGRKPRTQRTALELGKITHAVNLRVKADVRDLIDVAASAENRSRSDFMIEAARAAATESILSRTVFALDAKRYAAFLAKLDAKPARNAALSKTMKTPAPWDPQ